ncbi:cysteine-rich receptor-like protein kinase 4 [Pyrus ussuriensis x Pyrus communis]|uniref:non-specific serine/threonine protein kinase n=1 Tax=Pyrus ussuriensis x Pyrus communis TaxID=2448454 RepID=A0A5N5GUF0_9ROSA|nr:cysteine-rich receptor-like protein kinase 4 [Pyrus ussuriensis x Pyrus communis]
MASKNTSHPILFIFLVSCNFLCSSAQTWIRAGYWYTGSDFPLPEVNSALFAHLICAFANVNSSTYQLSIPSAHEQNFSSFTDIVKRKNPSITTLLSIWDGKAAERQLILGQRANFSVLSKMLELPSNRKSFVESSIDVARRYGFQGIDLHWPWLNTASDMINMEKLLDEWRAAVTSEARNSDLPRLILTMAVRYIPTFESLIYPVESMKRNLDWAHVAAYDYHLPLKENVTGAHAALYDPASYVNTDYGIKQWLNYSFPVSKLVLGMPYHGYAWTVANPKDNNGIRAPASGFAVTKDGSMSYKFIKWYTRIYGGVIAYNDTYVVNYCTVGSTWINFDDVEAIRAKIAYVKAKKLLGTNVFQVSNDDENWALSRAAQEEGNDHKKKSRLMLVIVLSVTSVVILIAFVVCFWQRELLKTRDLHLKFLFLLVSGMIVLGRSRSTSTSAVDRDAPNLKVYRFSSLKAATNNFSSENKLGEGGFGPGQLRRGQEIAVKRLLKTSTQGLQEFENEVKLTARLQHVNLVPVLGFCTEKEEKMLIYEYMPNKSLNFYLFDPTRRYFMDWGKHVHIIEGVTQGLLYRQEYSNFTIIHRDLKASNILLDDEMNAKIPDFGVAKLIRKDELQGNTRRIVGTYGYVPPEYIQKGIYSMKYDVYSFKVLLLQMISGRKSTLALLCVQENADDRPTMLEVYSMLKSDTQAVPTSTKAACSVKNYDNVDNICTPQPVSCSLNNAQISELQPR